MPAVETQIDIAVPPNVAYSRFMQFDKFPEWNPFIRQIAGDTQVGGSLEAHIQLPGASPMKFTPKVLVNKENEEFRWIGTFMSKSIMTGEHYFIFKPNGRGTTLVHGEQFAGVIGGLFNALYGAKTKQGFESMNSAFKQLCEH